MIKTIICDEGSRLVMYFDGRIETPDFSKVKKDMKELFDRRNRSIVLDLTSLKYICSSGLRLFLTLLQESHTTGNTVTVTGLSPYLHKVFDETGFTRMFKLQPAEDTSRQQPAEDTSKETV